MITITVSETAMEAATVQRTLRGIRNQSLLLFLSPTMPSHLTDYTQSRLRLIYRAEPKEPTQFGSVSGLEIQNLPFSHSGNISLYWPEPKDPT